MDNPNKTCRGDTDVSKERNPHCWIVDGVNIYTRKYFLIVIPKNIRSIRARSEVNIGLLVSAIVESNSRIGSDFSPILERATRDFILIQSMNDKNINCLLIVDARL